VTQSIVAVFRLFVVKRLARTWMYRALSWLAQIAVPEVVKYPAVEHPGGGPKKSHGPAGSFEVATWNRRTAPEGWVVGDHVRFPQLTFAPPLSAVAEVQIPEEWYAGPRDHVSEARPPPVRTPPKTMDFWLDVMSVIPNVSRAAGLRWVDTLPQVRVPKKSKYRQVSPRGPPLFPPKSHTAESADR
jgi:hypothetical protein